MPLHSQLHLKPSSLRLLTLSGFAASLTADFHIYLQLEKLCLLHFTNHFLHVLHTRSKSQSDFSRVSLMFVSRTCPNTPRQNISTQLFPHPLILRASKIEADAPSVIISVHANANHWFYRSLQALCCHSPHIRLKHNYEECNYIARDQRVVFQSSSLLLKDLFSASCKFLFVSCSISCNCTDVADLMCERRKLQRYEY